MSTAQVFSVLLSSFLCVQCDYSYILENKVYYNKYCDEDVGIIMPWSPEDEYRCLGRLRRRWRNDLDGYRRDQLVLRGSREVAEGGAILQLSYVDLSQCQIHNVNMHPGCDGSESCYIKRMKGYTLSVDFQPRFSAKKLNLSMYGDMDNDGVFETVVELPTDACRLLACPIKANIRRGLDIYFNFGKRFRVGQQFPVRVLLYNPNVTIQECCFTFNIKIGL